MVDELKNRKMEHSWNDSDKGQLKYLVKKPVPVPLCPSQIQHGPAWRQTWASAVTSRWLNRLSRDMPHALFVHLAYSNRHFKNYEVS